MININSNPFVPLSLLYYKNLRSNRTNTWPDVPITDKRKDSTYNERHTHTHTTNQHIRNIQNNDWWYFIIQHEFQFFLWTFNDIYGHIFCFENWQRAQRCVGSILNRKNGKKITKYNRCFWSYVVFFSYNFCIVPEFEKN